MTDVSAPTDADVATASTARRLLPIAAYLGGALLGAILLVAAWAKLLDPASFASQIEREGLAFVLPAQAVALIAIALEIGIGALLLLGVRRLWVLLPTTGLVAFFLFLTGRTYLGFLRGEIADEPGCGCFGNLIDRSPAEAFWQDLGLMVPTLALAWIGARALAPRQPWLRIGAAALLTVVGTGVAHLSPQLPLDDLATRLKPGMVTAEMCVGDEGARICVETAIPELAEGRHWVMIAGLEDEAFLAAVPALNERHWDGEGPTLWLLSDADEDALFALRWSADPAFDVREAPTALLRPMYRTLPRSFLVEDGVVVRTITALPPAESPIASAAR
ncbi:MAG: MauE/DoxX family redox-associated membrane protein [Acidobacteriota bacterium]